MAQAGAWLMPRCGGCNTRKAVLPRSYEEATEEHPALCETCYGLNRRWRVCELEGCQNAGTESRCILLERPRKSTARQEGEREANTLRKQKPSKEKRKASPVGVLPLRARGGGAGRNPRADAAEGTLRG